MTHGFQAPAKRKSLDKPDKLQLNVAIKGESDGSFRFSVADDGPGFTLPQADSGASSKNLGAILQKQGGSLSRVLDQTQMLGGVVRVVTEGGRGSEISLSLPKRLPPFRCVLFESRGRVFFLPVQEVRQIQRLQGKPLQQARKEKKLTALDKDWPLKSLSRLLGPEAEAPRKGWHSGGARRKESRPIGGETTG